MKLLVVMYSINVFLTFTLSQLGMVRHWWEVRRTEAHWRRRIMLASLGTLSAGQQGTLTLVANLGADLAYGLVDPRIRYGKGA